jgi:hypothetical protein
MDMDNDLDGRLRRLETAMDRHGKALDGIAARQEQTVLVMRELLVLMSKTEPDGPPLHEQLAQMTAVMGRSAVLAEQTLAAIERLGRSRRFQS